MSEHHGVTAGGATEPRSLRVMESPVADTTTRPIGRRVFGGILGAGAVGIAIGSPIQTVVEQAFEPLADLDPTGFSDVLPTSSKFRYYSVAGFNPDIDVADYRLDVTGMVDDTLALDYQDLAAMEQVGLTRDFQCVTGWRVPDVAWAGVRLADVLDASGASDAATHVRFSSADRLYTTTLTMDQARRDDVLVANRMLGAPVTREHGGPVRLFVAPMYGYKSLKWLSGIEVTDQPQPPGFWEERGYDVDAWVGESNGRDDKPTS